MLFKEMIFGYNKTYSRTPLVRINPDGEQFGFAGTTDNWVFL